MTNAVSCRECGVVPTIKKAPGHWLWVASCDCRSHLAHGLTEDDVVRSWNFETNMGCRTMTTQQQTRTQTHDVLETEHVLQDGTVRPVKVYLNPPTHAGAAERKRSLQAVFTWPDPNNPRMVRFASSRSTRAPQIQRQIDQVETWLGQSLPPTGKVPSWVRRAQRRSVITPTAIPQGKVRAMRAANAVNTMSADDKTKKPVPCSVCGGPAVIFQESDEPEYWFGSCDGDTDACVQRHTQDYATRGEAVDEWNATHGDAARHDAPEDKSVTLSPCPKCGQPASTIQALLSKDIVAGCDTVGCTSAAFRCGTQRKAVDEWEKWVAKQKSTDPEPLPCRECGGPPPLHVDGYDWYITATHIKPDGQPCTMFDYSPRVLTRAEAITAWNQAQVQERPA